MSDARLLTASKAIRGFAFGFVSVTVVVYLTLIGVDALTIGILLSVSALGSSVENILVSIYADRIGRRRTLMSFALVLPISSTLLLSGGRGNLVPIVAAFLLGTMSVQGSSLGPFQAIEQACLPETTERAKRNNLFSSYNMAGSFSNSIGFLFAGLQGAFASGFVLQAGDSFRLFFVIYAALGLVLFLIYSRLSSAIERTPAQEALSESESQLAQAKRPGRYSTIARLGGLFGLDSFASGLLGQSILTLWFVTRFNVGVGELSVIFFTTSLVATFSYPLAARIANRIGLVRTMVVTQIPSASLLILMAISPTFLYAVAFYLARTPVFQMDIPTKQAYTVSVVDADQRTTATSLVSTSRNIAQSISPSVAAYLIQEAAYSVPIFSAGAIKLLYSGLLYAAFRHKER